MKKYLLYLSPLIIAAYMTGCSLDDSSSAELTDIDLSELDPEAVEQAIREAAGGGGGGAIINNTGESIDLRPDLSNVTFLHANVSSWPITSNLPNVTVGGGMISLPFDKAREWPGRNTAGANVNANPWILVNQGGQWYAATWEWMRTGQTAKSSNSVEGGHIGQSPLNNFRPQSGQVYGFMVSGLARSNVRNVQERTNVVMIRWP
ncbi:MAG: hypothetical protein JJU29_02905 [Verrucomicrobia bacterium]|nr:hypothetical protein [Verrucomicrobiota bacterium]MCH8511122.1 hypothetical protein [Kiritimatiellia bacterium]